MNTKYQNGDVIAYCPDCKTHTSFEHKTSGRELETIIVDRHHEYEGKKYSRILYRLLRCASCKRGGLAAIHDNGKVVDGTIGEFYPISVEQASLPSDTPDDIKTEFREAELCSGFGAFRASSALFRSVLEKTLKANGYLKGTLAGKIDKAANDGVLTEPRRKRAHNEIRVLGNDVLHDEWRKIVADDVELAKHYAQRILEDFYDDRETVIGILIEKKRMKNPDTV
ncbi:DUF4145 domain-containing protein [Desulfobacula phenolica]|uniref:DUF4145 domain-containing protein n=1 Tax=Desulfobacula phenolica TaxID=90732 RepID=A0A1H2IDA2_9BACT|nr:DUF4145 domain-containing protein [Desulfobacula phenolica]SDU41985.1 protein of unknown function [Desulfobacula phenolica]